MTKEAKVGAFTLGGLLLFAIAVIKLSGMTFGEKGYIIYAGFSKVTGLAVESPVMLSGVPIGRVAAIENDGAGVTVTMRVQDGVKIAKDSIVTIESTGVMGEKFVSISQGKDMIHFFEAEDYMLAVDEAGMDTMFQNMNKAVLQVQDLLTALNGIIADPNLKGSLVDTAINIRETTAHLNGMMAGMESVIHANQANVAAVMQNLAGTMESMNATMKSVEHIMANMDNSLGNPETAKYITETLKNISITSGRIERVAKSLEDIATDEKTKEDIKATIHNARTMSEKADKMLGKVGGIQVTPSVDVMYSGKASKWRANFDTKVGMGDSFLKLGVEDIGEDNLFNAQVGKKMGVLGAHGGVIAGKIGLGLDAYGGDRFKFSAEAYDFNKTRVRLRSEYMVADDTFLIGEIQNLNKREERKTYFGIKRNF